jgi:hypothetical protein
VPAGAVAAVVSVSAVSPGGPGFVRVWPSGSSRPNATVLNYRGGSSTTNSLTVSLGASAPELVVGNFGA